VHDIAEPDELEELDQASVRAVKLELTPAPGRGDLQSCKCIDSAEVGGHQPCDIEVDGSPALLLVVRHRRCSSHLGRGRRLVPLQQLPSAPKLVARDATFLTNVGAIVRYSRTIDPELWSCSYVRVGVLTGRIAGWVDAGIVLVPVASARFPSGQHDRAHDLRPVECAAHAVAARIPRGSVDEVTGLLQLADLARPRSPVVLVVAGIALGAMALNAVAWIWGISHLLTSAPRRALVPRRLAETVPGGVPRRAIVLLTGLLGVGTVVLAVFPGIVVDAVAAAGAIFVLLYMLSIVSYVRVRGVTTLAGFDLVVLELLGVAFIQSGWRSLYALIALGLALVAGRRRV